MSVNRIVLKLSSGPENEDRFQLLARFLVHRVTKKDDREDSSKFLLRRLKTYPIVLLLPVLMALKRCREEANVTYDDKVLKLIGENDISKDVCVLRVLLLLLP